MGGVRPSSRVSIFSDDQYGAEDGRVPITEHQNSGMQHLAAKDEERNEPGVRECAYTASLIYMENRGNESRGSKMNSSESVRLERGEAMGGSIRMPVDEYRCARAVSRYEAKNLQACVRKSV